jgi:hypothetical protein
MNGWQILLPSAPEKKEIAIGSEVTVPCDSCPQALQGGHDRGIKSYTRRCEQRSKTILTWDGLYVFFLGWLERVE